MFNIKDSYNFSVFYDFEILNNIRISKLYDIQKTNFNLKNALK